MSSPAAWSDSSTLSSPPSSLHSPSPQPESSPSPPPKPARGKAANGLGKQKARDGPTKKKKKDQSETRIKLKLKQPKEEKKPQAKPREPKLEPIPRSLVNNYEVPLIVLFRHKFRSLFTGTSELGPQDVEEGVSVEGDLSGKLEEFVMRMCALIGNRRKAPERDQLGKALQETVDICFEKYGFRNEGESVSPMAYVTFATMDWDARLRLLRALVHWALLASDAVRQIIDDAYKVPPQSRVEREELDVNSGLAVIPLHTIKSSHYYLVEGKDTRFRIYHETNPHHKVVNFYSVVEDKPSLVEFAQKLSEGTKLEQEFAQVIRDTIIARIEAAEQRRIKAEQAALRLAMWEAAPPVYNTRTRGKKVDYSEFGKDSDSEEDEESRGTRRGRSRDDQDAVEYTASGRMIKKPRLENGFESRSRRSGEKPEVAEEMDWSEYSDKGETEDEADEGQLEHDDYDLGTGVRKSLMVKLKVPIHLSQIWFARNGTSKNVPSNAKGPFTVHSQPLSTPPKSSTQPDASRTNFQSRVQPSTPFAGAISPVPPTRPVQLSPQPIPRPFTVSNPTPPQPYQQSPPQNFTNPIQTSPRPYVPSTSPYLPPQASPKPETTNTPEWTTPPRPFGASKDSATSQLTPPPNPHSPPQSISPVAKPPVSQHLTWAVATFQPSSGVNGTSDDTLRTTTGAVGDVPFKSIPPPSSEPTGAEEQPKVGASGIQLLNGDHAKGG